MGTTVTQAVSGSRLSALILLTLAAVLLNSCSRSVPDRTENGVPPVVAAKTKSTITKEVRASVLILESQETGPQALGDLVVTPDPVVVDVGETVNLAAKTFLPDGTLAPDVHLSWTVSDVRAGTIKPNGEFKASRKAGEYSDAITVTAVLETGDDFVHTTTSVPVTVVGEQEKSVLTEVTILPTHPTVLSGQLYRFRAVAYDEHAEVIPGVDYEWKVADSSLGELNASGYLSVTAPPGKYIDGVTVVGRWNGVEVADSVDLTILDVPDHQANLIVQVLPQRFYIEHGDNMQLRAVAINGLGELVIGTQLRWSMVEPNAGSVSGTGMFVAGPEAGVYTEAVKVDAIIPGEQGVIHAADFASVVVRGEREKRRLDKVAARPGSVKLAPGGRTILAARALDSEGEPADDVKVRWEPLTEEAGAVDQFGVFRASDRPGVYDSAVRVIVTQSLGGELITRTATVDVKITGALTGAEVEPSLAPVIAGESAHFSAVGIDENGLVIPGLLVRWSVADPDLGVIDPLGNFTAKAVPGMHTGAIIATIIQTTTE